MVLAQEGYISICSHFNIVLHFLLFNPNTSYNTSQINILPLCWHLKRWWWFRPFTPHPLLQPSGPSRETWNSSSVKKIFEKSTFLLSSAHFERFCTYIFVNGSVVTRLADVSTFFRRRYRVVLDIVDSPIRLKSSPLIRPRSFRASRVIHVTERWETTLKWSLPALFRCFVVDATNFFTVWSYHPINLDISIVDLLFENSDSKVTRLIIWSTKVSYYSCKQLLLV